MIKKNCGCCGEVKPLTEFYAHSGMADGYLNKCKECCKLYSRIRRQEHPDVREKDSARNKTPKRRKYLTENSRKWREKHPEAYKAHNALNNAIRDGKVLRQPCEICGRENSHGHHDDYSKPLEVKWLCAICHSAEHFEK